MATASPPVSYSPRGPRGADPGRVVRIGGRVGRLQDVYHQLLTASWARLILTIAAVYLSANASFALAYLAVEGSITGARPGSFADAFFFSVQTFSTIGYGTMAPSGLYGSVVVTIEAFFGLLTVAMATGLMFNKFSRPTARVLFSKRLVVTRRDGKSTLAMRMANERGNDILEATVRITVLKPEVTAEGDTLRRLHDLKLVRGDTPLFSITFAALHVVDPASPLHGEDAESVMVKGLRFIVTVTGHDATFAQTIHARHIYEPEDLVWDARFVDVLSTLPDGRLQLDYAKFHDVELLAPKRAA